MTASLRAFSSLVLGGVVVAAVLSGCVTSAGTTPVPESTSGPDTADTSYAPRAAWLDATAFVLKTWSDACPPQVGDLVAGEQSLEIVLVEGEGEMCATVQTPHGMYIGLPAGFDSALPVEVTVTGPGGEETEITLPALADGEIIPADRPSAQVPAVARIADGELAVLTWGSSTCLPGSGTVEVTSETEGAIRLHAPTDTICTMDLVPQITFVPAQGVGDDAVLTLEGYVGADGEPVVMTFVR